LFAVDVKETLLQYFSKMTSLQSQTNISKEPWGENRKENLSEKEILV
jgi:hypothetical protein